jgi:hypothetical protein
MALALVLGLACGPGQGPGAESGAESRDDWDEEDGEFEDEFGSQRECMECIFGDEDDTCLDAWEACETDLACIQLFDCPFECGWTESCIDECNTIIPSGVPGVSRVYECMACAQGPCADRCPGAAIQAYCG